MTPTLNQVHAQHGLSTPPPTKPGRTAPREGILACHDGCPYRQAYGCQEEDLELGRSVGFCIPEYARGNALFQDAIRDVAWLPEAEREGLILAARRWMAAMLYAHRARLWLNRLTQEPDGPERTARLAVAIRYYEAGDSARQKLWDQLRPLRDHARLMKVACGPWRAAVAARKILEQADPDRFRPRRLELPPASGG